MSQTEMPKWFPEALIIAQHMDAKTNWPWYGKLYHYLFLSRKCPACIAIKKNV